MNEEIVHLRKRLQDLHDSHTTGFVDEAEYAQGRAYLERKLVDAVMRAELEEQRAAATRAEAAAREPLHAGPRPIVPPASRAGSSARRSRALGGVALLLAGSVAAAWWWAGRDVSTAASSAGATQARPATDTPPATPSVDAAPTASSSAVVIPVPEPVAGGTSISGTVMLDPALAARVSPQDTVFVYARAVEGPPVPLAVLRRQVKDLPLHFTLDDSMATWPAARVSAYPRVVVTARVSKTGEGQARAGDLEGQSPQVAAGAAGLEIRIANVVAK